MKKHNERNAGRKSNWSVPTTPITRRVPTEKIKEIDESIKKICEHLINKKTK